MPVQLDIFNDEHIVRYVITDPWTLEEYNPEEARDTAYRDSVDHRVHNLTIVKARHAPAGFLKVRSASTFNHRTAGHLAIVGTAAHIRILAEMIMRLARYDRTRFFDTEEQAMEYLRGIIQTENQSAKR